MNIGIIDANLIIVIWVLLVFLQSNGLIIRSHVLTNSGERLFVNTPDALKAVPLRVYSAIARFSLFT